MHPLKPNRRQFVLGTGSAVAGAALLGCSGQSTAQTTDAGFSAALCTTRSTGHGLNYCLVEPVEVRLADAATLAVGQVLLFNVDDSTAVIVARDDRGFYALSGICTHQCCVLTICDGDCTSLFTNPGNCGATPRGRLVNGAAFFCACHGSEFGADGSVLTGPATEALPAVTVRREGNDLVADLGKLADPEFRIT
ncbi:MAG: FeS-binding protein [Myxococcales bacterium]|nr:FeS-binding protein [Myxococcales bacterium]